MRLMVCMGAANFPACLSLRTGPTTVAILHGGRSSGKEAGVVQALPPRRVPDLPDGAGTRRGEQIKLINPAVGAEKVDVHLNRLVPGGPRGKHHHHTKADNVYIVKRGEGTLTIEDKTYTVRENDVVYIPAGVRHSLSNLSNDVFEIFEIYAPSGKHMDFVLDE